MGPNSRQLPIAQLRQIMTKKFGELFYRFTLLKKGASGEKVLLYVSAGLHDAIVAVRHEFSHPEDRIAKVEAGFTVHCSAKPLPEEELMEVELPSLALQKVGLVPDTRLLVSTDWVNQSGRPCFREAVQFVTITEVWIDDALRAPTRLACAHVADGHGMATPCAAGVASVSGISRPCAPPTDLKRLPLGGIKE